MEPNPTPAQADRAPAPQSRQARIAGAGLCAVSAAGFAGMTILAKLAIAAGLSIWTVIVFRFSLAALLLLIFVAIRSGRSAFPPLRQSLHLFALGALGYAVQSFLFFVAIVRLPASITSVLLYAYPVFVALLDWGLRRRRPSLLIWLATVLALSGVVLTVGPIGLRMHSAALDPFGVAAILVSALCYAGYIVLSERPVAKHGPLVSTAIITSGTSVGFTLLGLLTGWLTQPPSWLTLGYGLAMALLGGVLAMGTFLAGITRVGPTIASLISTLEPVFTVLLAMLILHETLATHQVAGGVFILAAVLLITAPRRLKVRQR